MTGETSPLRTLPDGGSEVGVSGRASYKFAPGPRTNVTVAAEAGGLAATVRYEDEREIVPGDIIDLLTALTGEKFGEGTVQHVEPVRAWKALDRIRQHGATYRTQSIEKLVVSLNEFYEAPIRPTTKVRVIIFEPDPRSLRRESSQKGGFREANQGRAQR